MCRFWLVILSPPSLLCYFAVLVTLTRAEECGHEELNKCSKSLQALNSASDLNFTPRREELDELCPELEAGLRCISSYTRRCMTLQKRNQFMKIYKGTKEVIRDICKEGEFQNEFLKHAACLRTVKPKHKKCEEKYQETMNSIKAPKTNGTDGARDDDVKNVCWWVLKFVNPTVVFERSSNPKKKLNYKLYTRVELAQIKKLQKIYCCTLSRIITYFSVLFPISSLWQLIPRVFGLLGNCYTTNLWRWYGNIHPWLFEENVIDLGGGLLSGILSSRR